MTTKDDTTSKPQAINPMLGYWHWPFANDQLDRETKRFQALAADLQTLATETYARQIKALSTVHERVAGSVPEFLGCRQHLDVAAIGAKLVADIMDVASQQARTWAELSQTLRNRSAAAAEGLVQQSGDAGATETAREKEPASPEPARRKSA